MDLVLLGVAALTLLTSLVVFRITIPLAHTYGLVDTPDSRRRHARPVPVIGGVNLLLAWAMGIAAYSVLRPQWFYAHHQSILVVGASMSILTAMGLVDDLKGMGPRYKLLGQVAAAAIVMCFEPSVNNFCHYWYGRLGFIAIPAVAIWLIGLSNAVNLVDGLDGLAGGISTIVSVSMVVLSLRWGGQGEFSLVLSLLLVPSLLGFLRHNWNPAKIFLGDNGSLPIGFLIGTISLMSPIENRSWMQIINIVLMMGYPILDMGLCTYRRWKKKTPLFKADRNHLHHRLLRFGMTVPQTTVVLLSITLFLQLSALSITDLVKTEKDLFEAGLIYISSAGLSVFSLLYLLRAIERALTTRVSRAASNRLKAAAPEAPAPEYKECTIARIELEPLFEAGLFEEKERVHQVVASLKLMLQGMVRREDVIYLSHQTLNIVFVHETSSHKARLQELQAMLKQKLGLFQSAYNLQYSLADLPISFVKQDFLINREKAKLEHGASLEVLSEAEKAA